MLIAVAIVTALNLGFAIVSRTIKPEDKKKGLELAEQSMEESRKSGIPFDLDPERLKAANARLAPKERELIRISLSQLLMPAAFLGQLSLCAWVVYRTHPSRKRRRGHIKPLEAEEAPTVVSDLKRLATALDVPNLKIEHSSQGIAEGEAFGLRGSEVLVLYGHPSHLEKTWNKSDLYKVIALHELSHIANRDAQEREKSEAFWYALLLSTPLFAWNWAPAAGRLIVLLLLTRLIQHGLIRIRERYADWRLTSWSFGTALASHLSTDRRQSRWWKRWAGFHPSFRERRKALAEPGGLFHITADLAFTSGLLFALVVLNVPLLAQIVAHGLASLFGLWARGIVLDILAQSRPLGITLMVAGGLLSTMIWTFFFFLFLGVPSYLASTALGVQVQREIMAAAAGLEMERRELWRPALLFASGIETGHLVTPFSVSPFSLPKALAAAAVLFAVFWLGAWLWLRYIHSLTAFVIARSAGRDPRGILSSVIVFATALLTFSLGPLIYIPLFWTVFASWELKDHLTETMAPGIDLRYVLVETGMEIGCGIFFFLFLGILASWIAVSLTLQSRKPRCPNCGKQPTPKLSLRRACDFCGADFPSWAFTRVEPLLPDFKPH